MAWVAVAATVLGGVMGAVQQRNAGIIQSNQLKAQATSEGDAARQREIDRKRQLLRVLSAQSARAGAMGVTMDGSLGAMARTDIRDASNDLQVDQSNTNRRISQLQMGANNALSQGNLGAGVSLFDTAAKTANIWPGGKSSTLKSSTPKMLA